MTRCLDKQREGTHAAECPASATPIAAVVAAFRPDESISHNIGRVVGQVERVIVVDDGSGSDWSDLFAGLADRWGDRVAVVRLEANRGIAAALNVGLREALRQGARSVLTLDQDSRIAENYVEHAAAAADHLRSRGRQHAAIAAGAQTGQVVRAVIYQDRGDRLTPTLEAIQSGLLIPRTVIENIGMFDESLFIDCVDTDFVVRAARAGLPTYLARDCEIAHPLGSAIDVGGLRITRSGRRSFAFHPAWRRYYISRNRALMLWRHGLHEPRWAVMSVLGETVQFARSLAFGPDKALQTAAFALGVLDAVRGRRGRLRGRPAQALGAP